jgi:orotidine-5'-phosphate decarboxylase
MAEVILALDVDSADAGRRILDRLPDLRWVKVGSVLMTREGAPLIAELRARGLEVFLDMKWHDIPNTVAGAAAAAAAHGASMLTVHASGGSAMVVAAVEAAPGVDILAVTVLTSLDDVLLAELGMDDADVIVPRLAMRAIAAGAAGIVCAGNEIATVRGAVPDSTVIVVPGVRPEGAAVQDQARVVTPRAAVDAGADVLVVGRPVTQADDPVAAVRAVRRQMTAEAVGRVTVTSSSEAVGRVT